MTRRPLSGKRGGLSGEAGFTLLETLIAVTLLGMLTVVLAASLRTGTRVWERGESHARAMDDIRTVQDFIRRIVEAAYPYLVVRDGADPFVDFDGQPQSLTVLAPAPVSIAPGGRARFTLQSTAQSKGWDFIMKARPELQQPTTGTDDDSERLLSGLEGISFAYYGSVGPDQELQWHERWSNRLALPQLVRIRITFPPGDARRWPELIVKPRLFADVSCTYDPLTYRCRGR